MDKTFSTFDNFINRLTSILGNGVATLLMTIAFVAFLLAVINFIGKRAVGDGKGMIEARDILWWSVFALFIMTSVWGLVNFLSSNLLGAEANKTTVAKPQTCFGCTGTTGGPAAGGTKKKAGESCTVLAGGKSNSQCVSGTYCSDGNVTPRVGATGNCVSDQDRP